MKDKYWIIICLLAIGASFLFGTLYSGVKIKTPTIFKGKYYAGMCGVDECVCYGRLHYEGKSIIGFFGAENKVDSTITICSSNPITEMDTFARSTPFKDTFMFGNTYTKIQDEWYQVKNGRIDKHPTWITVMVCDTLH